MAMAAVPFVADQPYRDDHAQDDLDDGPEKPLLQSHHSRNDSAGSSTDAKGWAADSQPTQRRGLRRLALLLLLAIPIVLLSSNASVVESASGWAQHAAGKCGLGSWAASWNTAPVEPLTSRADDGFVFGVGIGDITGPIVETNMMGYAAEAQTNTGLHTRLRARAFIVGSQSSVPPTNPPAVNAPKDPEYSPGGEEDPVDGLTDRWILLNTDLCMGDTAVRRGLIAKLRDAYPGVYGERNIAFIGTHSHAGVAGFHNNLLPTVTSFGVVQDNYDAIVEGSFRAVQRAHQDYEARRQRTVSASSADANNANKISFGNATLRDAHTNRSPYAYDFNPTEWKEKYDSNQDDSFSLIKFEEAGASKAFASFYAVHGTALSANNTLTSTDNKGLAALWYEQEAEPDSLPGQNSFIAGFVQASVGDTSPNTLGARCPDGSPCDYKNSTCLGSDGKNTTSTCFGRGPGFGDEAARELSPTGGYDWRSNEIIARLQVDAAKGIMDRTDLLSLTGTVKSAKMNVDMNSYTFDLPNGTSVTTCPAALGFSFGGGTTDFPGPKGLGLEQGTNNSDHTNPLLTIVSHLIRPPSPATTKCHLPKKILLATGQLDLPYQWSPHIVETQILKVGSLFILVTPSEFTTMAGRLLKEAVRDAVIAQGIDSDPITVVAGPANTYSHYVTTLPEYNAQRYEGGSTLYGPHTLDAYLHIYSTILVPSLKDGASDAPKGTLAPINIRNAFKLQSKVVYDSAGLKRFGDVLLQPNSTYTINSNLKAENNVTVSFVGANPRNDLRLEGTFFEVQRQNDDGSWKVVRNDAHHTTTMRWTRVSKAVGNSRVDIGWAIEKDTPPGKYRIVYYGNSKTPVTGSIKDFEGMTEEFTLQ